MAQKFLFCNMAQWFIFFFVFVLFSWWSTFGHLQFFYQTWNKSLIYVERKTMVWIVGQWSWNQWLWKKWCMGWRDQWCEISIERSKCNWNNHIISVLWKRDLCTGCVNVNGGFDHTMIAKSLKMSLEMFF